MAEVEIGLLGPVEVRLDGQVLALGGMRPRAVLAVLVLADGATVSEQRLVEALWGEELPPSARNSLQSHISRLRTALGPMLGRRLRREPAGYRLVLQPGEVDVHRVQALADRARAARAADPAAAARLLVEALALWRGPALAEFADLPGLQPSGLAADRVRLDELQRALGEDLLDTRLESGEHAELLPDLEAAAATDPLRERTHRLLATALYRCGRASDALATLRRYRDRLAEETGLDPTSEVEALEAALLARDPGLDPPSVPQPPAPSAAPPTVLLIPPANTFFGRVAERAALAAALRTHRLVTVTGPGGVGKTRLVLESLAGVAEEVVLLDLAPLAAGADVLAALAARLGVRPSATTALTEAVLDLLREQRLLLVLDNCEHVAPAVVDLVTAILQSTPAVRLLATSRRRLGLPEEQVVPLGPLPVPPEALDVEAVDLRPISVLLFTDRARRVRPTFALTPVNSALVGRICRRLDGLPLALELAASTVGALDLDTLAASLDSQLDLAGPAGSERHPTLRAVVESSFAQLDEADRGLFAALSVFPDWFDASAAQEVAEPDDAISVIGGLVRLVDASLVMAVEVADGRLRYRMLETLRRHGLERLRHDGRYDAASARFVGWAANFAERAERGLRGPAEATWVRRVEIELANLRAAWQQALAADDIHAACRITVALSEHAMLRSLLEPWTWAITLARRPDLPEERAVAVLGAAALSSCRLGDPRKAETFARNGLARAAGSAPGRWRCLHPLSTALMMRGDHEGAAQCSRDAAAEPDCPPTVRAYLEANVGLARSYAGTADPSDNDRPTADLIHGDWPTGRAWGWYVAAEAVRLTDPWESLRRLDRAVDEARRVESVFIQGLAEVGMVAAALRVGDHATALRLFPDAIRGWQRSGSWLQQWTTLRTLATLLTELGAHEQAAVLVGAIDTAPEAPAVAGAEATADAALRRRLEARLGTVPFARQTARGAAQPRTAVVEYALRVIDAVSPTVPAAGEDPASAEISTWAPTAG